MFAAVLNDFLVLVHEQGIAVDVSGWSFARGLTYTFPPGTSIAPRRGWIHHPRLSQNDYEQVLGHAAVVVYFSAYEGFGMPPVEGTLAGAAAVYSALPAMREVMNGCGYSFNNDSFEEFAHRMDEALSLIHI